MLARSERKERQMEKVTLQSMLVDYSRYRKQKNAEEKTKKTTNYETCRQNLSDIMNVLGVDVRYFKENFGPPSQPFQFAEKDRQLLFDILDQYTSNEIVLIRKGEIFDVPVESLTFYLDAFTTMLKHLEIDEEIVREQREAMMRCIHYELAVEISSVRGALKGIKQDIQQMLESEDDLYYSDYVAMMKELASQLQALRDRSRHVYMFLDNRRSQENLKSASVFLQRRPGAMDNLKKRVKLDQELRNNERYAELVEQLERITNESTFLKKKLPQYEEVLEEMDQISEEMQLREFGEILMHGDESGEESSQHIPSGEALKLAVKEYELLYASRSYADPLVADELYTSRFGDNSYREGANQRDRSGFDL